MSEAKQLLMRCSGSNSKTDRKSIQIIKKLSIWEKFNYLLPSHLWKPIHIICSSFLHLTHLQLFNDNIGIATV